MIQDHFVYGTQYYRAPTPLPEEWEGDISKHHELGLNTFQIRAQWRWNEPSEGNYRFDDIDRLFELARKYKRKVIFKFMLETAPQYIFDKFDGERRDLRGLPIRAGSHGAYYVGGWWPCFDNPGVRERATRFIEECVKRYKDREELILWNAWNEPRSRPTEDCACKHSINEFRKWLKEEYKTIENFNNFFGVSEESFETIPSPGLPHGYWDFFLFRKWRGTRVMEEMIKWVYDTIRSIDTKRPIMCHIGLSSCFQRSVYDTSDDMSIAKSVDLFGTSYYTKRVLKNHKDEIFCGMNPDFTRHVDRNFFIQEFYPDWGDWTEPIPAEDLRFKLWTALSRAPKGIVYWQYRAERVGNENNLAGLTHMDGRFNARTIEAGKAGKVIEANRELFESASVPRSDVAILFDFDSSLISQVEDVNPQLWSYETSKDALYYYSQANRGMYELFFDLSMPIDYLDTRDMSDILEYKVVYLPYLAMVRPEVADKLKEFVLSGGVLLADEGFGLRQLNTWLHPAGPDRILHNLTPARWIDRVKCDGADSIKLPTGEVTVLPMRTVYETSEGSVVAQYSNGQPAIHEYKVGKGRVLLFGASIGYSYAARGEEAWVSWLSSCLSDLKIRRNPCDDIKRSIYSRMVTIPNGKMIFIFNRSKAEQIVDFKLDENTRELTGQVSLDREQGKVILPAGQVACLVCEY